MKKFFSLLFPITFLLVFISFFSQKSFATNDVFVGAGDICGDSIDHPEILKLGISMENAEATAKLILAQPSATVFTAGDNVQISGVTSEFTNCFNPTWGQFKDRIHPAIGNHEYGEYGQSTFILHGANPYFDYFGQTAGNRGQGWYSYNLTNNWHVIVLNSECYVKDKNGVYTCDINSQEKWLKNDLANNSNKHIIAIWHIPRFSSSAADASTKVNATYKVFWDDLYNAKTDIVINGHYHVYERFAKQNPDGNKVSSGIREFIVGTGGYDHHNKFTSTLLPNSEVSNDTSFGVLKLTLHENSYDWQFIPVAGQSFTDSGTSTTNLNYTPAPKPTVTPTPKPTVTPTPKPTVTPTPPTCTTTCDPLPDRCDGKGTPVTTCKAAGGTTSTTRGTPGDCTTTPIKCELPNTCDGSGVCVPPTCDLPKTDPHFACSENNTCVSVPGCDNSSGDCTKAGGSCGCVPKTSCDGGQVCGQIDDGCGGIVTCPGSCDAAKGEICNSNTCSCPAGKSSTHLACASDHTCQRVATCGTDSCTEGQNCNTPTTLSFTIGLDGIGHVGDRPNPTTWQEVSGQHGTGSNQNPTTNPRIFDIKVGANDYPNQSFIFDTTSGLYTGTVDLVASFATGPYLVTIETAGYLIRKIPNVTITAGSTTNIHYVDATNGPYLVPGDIDMDNHLTSTDYSILLSCLSDSDINDFDNHAICNQNANYKTRSDLDDNGTADTPLVNKFDYNLFVREFSKVQTGD
jgi:hypothetical protein